jgi:hypothetical protein
MAQFNDTLLLKKLIESRKDLFGDVLKHPTKNEIQVIYTQVNRDQNNKPSFKTFSYNLNQKRYFYPASTVKLAAVIFALEKVNELNIKNLSANSVMLTDSSFKGQTKVISDESAQNGKPSIAHYIKKILLTSDNDAYNRLYEFIGRAEFNYKLKKYGFSESRIINRLAIGDGGESARHTNPIRFFEGNQLVYQQAAQYDDKDYPLELTNLKVGKGYINSKNDLVNEPFDFSGKNVFPIANQHELLKRLMLPNSFPKKERFNLTAKDYQLIHEYMSMLPTQSDYPKYDPKEIWPAYTKMLFYGSEKESLIDPNLKIYNKCGNSYGYILDNAYFVDLDKKIEFFLTAVVQSNENQIYIDDNYEYDTVCYPFMKNLGKVIYEFEIERKK